jgi:hypothetical protein
MKPQFPGKLFVAAVLVAAPLLMSAQGQDGQAGAPSATAATKPELKYSPGVEEVLKLVGAGVSKEVVKTFIENSPIAYNLGAGDIIALKEHGVTDDLTSAMVKRRAELSAQAGQTIASVAASTEAAPAVSPGNAGGGYLDPESYDFWWYYYAYPRTLAYANQRLYAPYPPYSYSTPYAYGNYRPMPFRPYPPGAFAHRQSPGDFGNFPPPRRGGGAIPPAGSGGQRGGRSR